MKDKVINAVSAVLLECGQKDIICSEIERGHFEVTYTSSWNPPMQFRATFSVSYDIRINTADSDLACFSILIQDAIKNAI
jgi:hypothetical protein